jgi:uncharacterized protein with HEPN domain
MLRHAQEAVQFASGRTRADLDTDRQLNLALVRLLEIIGEVAARVSTPTRDNHPQIPWSQIVGLRNHLIHGYDTVDFDIVWRIVEVDLPPLIAELSGVVGGGSAGAHTPDP